MSKEGTVFRNDLLKLPKWEDVVSGTAYQTIKCGVCHTEYEHAYGNEKQILCDECRAKLGELKDPSVEQVNDIFQYPPEVTYDDDA